MDREKVISKLEKEVQRTYSTKTTVFQNGEKVSEEINTHREPCVRIPIEMADKILALLKEQEAKWIEDKQGEVCRLIRCSNCGLTFIVGNNIPYDEWIEDRNYCRRCGARMVKPNDRA